MNFYKYFISGLVILLMVATFPYFILSANEPLSIFFISETTIDGQLITIKNISASRQGNWRLALMGENAEQFLINGQAADFERDGKYVQLPHSLPIGGEWSFILTTSDLAAGQHAVELALWTTQGASQHPFNGIILGRTTLFVVVEEKEVEDEDKNDEEEKDEGYPEPVPDEDKNDEVTEPKLDDDASIPEAEFPPETPQTPGPPTSEDNGGNDYGNGEIDEDVLITTPEYAVLAVAPEEYSPIENQIPSQISAPIASTSNYAPVNEGQIPAHPQNMPAITPQDIPNAVPHNLTGEASSQPPLSSAPAPIMEIDERVSESTKAKTEPDIPFQNVANPQTCDNKGFILTILSFISFVFSVMIFEILQQKSKNL